MMVGNQSIGVIRCIAAIVAIFGLVLIGNEILEQVTSCQIGLCERIHLTPLVSGLALTVFGCLILQKGDVSTSLLDFTSAYERIRYGRRSYDKLAVPPEIKNE